MKKTAIVLGLGLLLGSALPASVAWAGQGNDTASYTVELPLIQGWFKGQKIYYLQTEASDAGLAASQQATYVPILANAAAAVPPAVDDIYHVTNFTQANVVPSAPLPEGPTNTNAAYSPLWQVSLVTWSNPSQARVLTSEEDVLAAQAAGLVTIAKTTIVVNCSIMYSPQGGTFPQARIIAHEMRDMH